MKTGRFYHTPPVSTSLMTNQGILAFDNGYVITMAHWKPYFEVSTLALVWMAMNPLLIMMNRVIQRGGGL